MKEDNVSIINLQAHFEELTSVRYQDVWVTRQGRMMLADGNMATELHDDENNNDCVHLRCMEEA